MFKPTKGIVIWGLAALYYFYDNLLNVIPSAIKPELIDAYAISAADFGTLASCYLWAYGLMQIPAGLMMDKIGPRKVITIASIFCAFGSFLFYQADSLLLAKVGRLFVGFGASFAVIGCSKIASNWFLPKRFALLMGLMATIGMLGAALGLTTINWLIEYLSDWRKLILCASIVGFIFALIIWLVIRDNPNNNKIKTGDIKNNISLLQGLKLVASSSQSWLVSIYAGLMFVPTLAFGVLWGVPFLVEGHGIDRDTAGQIISLMFIGWSFGGPIYGWFSDFIGKRNQPMYFANIATLITSLLIIYVPNLSRPVMSCMMFLLGFFSSGFILAFAVIREKNPRHLAATVIGFINTLNTFGGAAIQVTIGKALDYIAANNNTISPDSTFLYSDYQMALISIPICLVISLIMITRVDETNCLAVD